MFSGVPLYPVEMMRLSSTIIAPTRLPLQLARRRAAMAMFIKYLWRSERASRAACGSYADSELACVAVGIGPVMGTGSGFPLCLAMTFLVGGYYRAKNRRMGSSVTAHGNLPESFGLLSSFERRGRGARATRFRCRRTRRIRPRELQNPNLYQKV